MLILEILTEQLRQVSFLILVGIITSFFSYVLTHTFKVITIFQIDILTHTVKNQHTISLRIFDHTIEVSNNEVYTHDISICRITVGFF